MPTPGTISELQKWRRRKFASSYTEAWRKYESIGIPCLVRDADSGIFCARAKVAGRIFFRSLDATKITTAKLRLPDKLKEIRENVSNEEPTRDLELKATFLDAATLYEKEVNADSRLEPSTAYVRVRPRATLAYGLMTLRIERRA